MRPPTLESGYRGLVEHLRDTAVFVIDSDLRYVFAAGPALEAAGLSGADLVGERLVDHVGPADYAEIAPLIKAAFAGAAATSEYRSTRNGRSYLVDVTPMPHASAPVETVQAVVRDTTELRDSQQVASTAWATYMRAVASAPLGVAVVGSDNKLRFLNDAFRKLTGLAAGDAASATLLDLVDEYDRAALAKAVDAARAGSATGSSVDVRVPSADGDRRWVSVNAVWAGDGMAHDTDPDRDKVLVFLVDLSARIAQEDLLRRSEERFRLLADAATEGVCITEDGLVVTANPALARILGYEPDALIGLGVDAMVAPEFRPLPEGPSSPAGRLLTVLRKDGTRIPVLATTRAISHPTRRLRVATVTDLSEHARAAALDERRRVARDLHDGLAHELAFISSKARALARDGAGPGDLDALITAADRALDEARRAISVLSSTSREPLGAVLARTAEDLASRHAIGLRLDLAADLDAESEVSESVVRVAREAITNAARHGHASTVTVQGWRDGVLHVVVCDDGCGFEPSGVERGFGLISMRERAEALGGTLDLTAAPGAGARVELTVP